MVICAFIGSLAAEGIGVFAAHPARSKTSIGLKRLGLIRRSFLGVAFGMRPGGSPNTPVAYSEDTGAPMFGRNDAGEIALIGNVPPDMRCRHRSSRVPIPPASP